jgi:hypothetical protein
MEKRNELNDPQSCINKAEDKEWVFVLLAPEPLGPVLVRE